MKAPFAAVAEPVPTAVPIVYWVPLVMPVITCPAATPKTAGAPSPTTRPVVLVVLTVVEEVVVPVILRNGDTPMLTVAAPDLTKFVAPKGLSKIWLCKATAPLLANTYIEAPDAVPAE